VQLHIVVRRFAASRNDGGVHNPIWRLARSFMISSVPPPIKLGYLNLLVMAGLRPGHPRLSCLSAAKTWMPGIADKFTQSAQD
jgi:hypothetical protein